MLTVNSTLHGGACRVGEFESGKPPLGNTGVADREALCMQHARTDLLISCQIATADYRGCSYCNNYLPFRYF